MCKKHMYQCLLWLNTSHFMFSLRITVLSLRGYRGVTHALKKRNLCTYAVLMNDA